jgi:hypothetical protein
MIILDEFQHFIDRESQKVLKTISDWLKVLVNRTKLPIILIGMPKSETVLDAAGNEQLKRRFSARATLEPFSWGADKEQQEEMSIFLAQLDEALDLFLPEQSHLAGEEIACLIHIATGGIVDKIMKLIRGAARLALSRGIKSLDLDLLAEAYEEHLANNKPECANPFFADYMNQKSSNRHRSSKTTPGNSTNKATNKRVHGRKKGPSLSDILNKR